MVRVVSEPSQRTISPFASDSRASAASSGSTPMMRACGASALIAVAIPADTLADGMTPPFVGALPLAIAREAVDEIVTVTEDEMAEAMRQLATRGRLVVEASGAAGMAAHLSGAASQPKGDDQRVIVISGGNVDPTAFAEILLG